MPPLSWDHFFHELCVSLACAFRNGTTRSTCCFLPPIKVHIDRLRLLLVCAALTHLGKMMSAGERWRWVVVVVGVSERERLIQEEKERKNMHMNPEGLMCLHYLGCDLSPTSSTSIMHHIHKHGTELGAPATHSYCLN